MGKPIITTNLPGCRDVVEDGVARYLSAARDPRELAEKMRSMLRLPKRSLYDMGSHARERVMCEFDERIVIERYLDTIALLQLR